MLLKKIIYALTLWTLIMGLVVVAPTYASAPPAAVTISQVMSQAPPATFDPTTGVGTNYGTWSASGAFGDSGTAVENFRLRFGCGGICSVHAAEILTSSSNPANTVTIKVRLDGFTFISPTEIRFEGKWNVASGTGAYEDLEGHGSAEVIVNIALAEQGLPSNFITSTGVAHLP